MISVHAGSARPFAATVASFLDSESFSHHRWATFHGRDLLVVRSPAASLALHLLPTPQSPDEVLPAVTSAELSDAYIARDRPQGRRRAVLVHLWEDQWHEHTPIVTSRLLSMLGRSTRLMARSTVARRIDSATVDAFLLENHLWGATKSRYRYGLYSKAKDEQLVAVASFSPRWNVRRRGSDAPPRASHELIRYCSYRGTTVVGGISKLLKAFTRDASPDEIVTVIDRDWGAGGGWATLGFRSLKKMPPVTFFIGPDGRRCHPGSGPNPHRRRLPPSLLADLEIEIERSLQHVESDEATASATDASTMGEGDNEKRDEAATLWAQRQRAEKRRNEVAERFLAERGYYAVRDAGAERHLLMITDKIT